MNGHQESLTRTLRAGLAEVVGVVQAFPAESVDRMLRPGEWPVRRHVHHLRQIEGRYLERLEGVLTQGAYVPSQVEHAPPPEAESVDEMLAGFIAARTRALAVFEALDDDQWEQVFTHPTVWGEVTVEWWAERFIQHTAEHLQGLWMLKQLLGLSPEAYERVIPNIDRL
jgi:hypothetical protein